MLINRNKGNKIRRKYPLSKIKRRKINYEKSQIRHTRNDMQ